MIENNFITVSLISIVVWILYRVYIFIKNKKVNLFREFALSVFFIYFLLLLLLTIFKGGVITLRNPFNDYMYNEYGVIGIINIVPIKETITTFMHSDAGLRNTIRNIVGNIIAFIPLGFFVPLLFDKFNNYKKIFKVGFLASLTIEITQLFVGWNVCDIDDIIYNTLGAIVGLLCFKTFETILNKINLKEKLDKIRDFETNHILKKSIKGILIVFGVIVVTYIYAFYNQTMSSKLSDEEMAQKAFNCNINDIIKIEEFNGNKFYLIKNEYGLEVREIRKFIFGRSIESHSGYSFIENDKYGYKQEWIDEDGNDSKTYNRMSPIVYGKNKDADKIAINVKGKKIERNINKNDYFMVIYPELTSFDEEELRKIYDGKGSKDIISIKFLDENSKEINNFKNLDEIEE